MSRLRRIVLDVLKPHEPSIMELSKAIGRLTGVDGVDISVFEIDKKVENVKITVEGPDINFDDVEKIIIENGGTIHSIDKVSTGRKLIEEADTPQDAN